MAVASAPAPTRGGTPRAILWLVAVALLATALVGLGTGASEGRGAALVIPAVAIAVGGAIAAVLWLDTAWIMTASLGLAVFSGHWPDMGSPIPLDRVSFAAAVASLAMRIPLDPRRWRWPTIRPVHLTLVVAAVWVVMSAFAAGTLGSTKTRFEILDAHGLVPFFYLATVPLVFRTRRQREILLGGLLVVAAYLGLTALFEQLDVNDLVRPTYISDPNRITHLDRARGPFIEAGAMGLALIGGIITSVIWFVVSTNPKIRVACGAVAVLDLLGVVFTLTRAVWVAAAVAVIVVMIAAPRLRRYLPVVLVGTVVAVGALYVLVPGLATDIKRRNNDNVSVWSRLNSNAAGVRMLEEKPLVGWGYDTFAVNSKPYYRLSPNYPINGVGDLHQVFLGNLVELGLLGTAAWLGALLTALTAALRGLRRAPPQRLVWQLGGLAYVVSWAVDANFTPLTYPYPNILLWFLLGLAIWPVEEESAPSVAT